MQIGSGITEINALDQDDKPLPAWKIDVMGVWRKVNAARAIAAATPDPYAYLDVFKALVKEAGGPDLNDSQADELFDLLEEDYLQKKSARKPSAPSSATSRSSTGSIPPRPTGTSGSSPAGKPIFPDSKPAA